MHFDSLTISLIARGPRYLLLPVLIGLVSALASVPFVASASDSSAATWSGWSALDTIVVVSPTDPFLDQAADELQDYLQQISGRPWNISHSDIAGPAIRLLVNPANPNLAGRNDEGVHILSDDQGVHITGVTPLATRHGAYIFLEELGTRWYFKHSMWEVVPNSLPDITGLDEVHEPVYVYRRLWHPVSSNMGAYLDWKERNRLDGATEYKIIHNYNDIVLPTDPDAPASAYCGSQLLPEDDYVIASAIDYAQNYLAKPAVSDWDRRDAIPPAVAPISPNDGRGWCWDDDDLQQTTDRAYSLTASVAEALRITNPNQFAGIYSYSSYSGLPAETDLSNVFVQVATAFDHTPLNDQERIAGLTAKGATVGIREYIEPWNWFEDLPRGTTRHHLDNIRFYAQNGVTVYNGEASDSWGVFGPLMYAASKLFWDPYQDQDAILQEFFTTAFGPAAAPIERYYERWFQGQPVSDRSLALSFQSLRDAETLTAGNADVLDRVRFLQYHARYMWLWTRYRDGILSLDEVKDLYKYTYRIKRLYVIFQRYPEAILTTYLTSNGVTEAELAALRDTTLPSEAEATAWMNEAQTYFATVNAVDVDVFDATELQLSSLPATGLADLQPGTIRDNEIVVPATAGDTVQLNFITLSPFFGNFVAWYAPDGMLLDKKSVAATRDYVSVSFTAPTTGNYTIKSDGTIDVISHPAAVINTRIGVASQNFYFYVPVGTPGLVVNVISDGTVDLFDHYGTHVFQQTCTIGKECEGSLASPSPGIWRLDWTGPANNTSGFQLIGVAPLLWHNPANLLAPASAVVPFASSDYYTTKPGSALTVESDPDGPALLFTDAVDAPVSQLVLPAVGDSTVVRVAARNIAVDTADTVQLKILHDATVVDISDVRCIGLYAAGLVDLSGVVESEGSWAICATVHGPLASEGPVIEFTATRVSDGDATLSISEIEPLETMFIEAGVRFRNMVPPILVDTSATVDVLAAARESESLNNVGVLANDFDPQGQSLQVNVQTTTAHGVLALNSVGGSFTYEPEPGFTGTDSFTYTVSDGSNISPPALVTIDVGATMSGNVSVQAVEHDGTGWHAIAPLVTLTPDGGGSGIVAAVRHDGSFSFNGVFPGEYTVRAAAYGFQSAERTQLTIGESDFVLPDVELTIGLVNSGSLIDGSDLSLVVISYGLYTDDRTDSSGNWVDLNGDGAVSALDISLVLVNIGTFGIQAW